MVEDIGTPSVCQLLTVSTQDRLCLQWTQCVSLILRTQFVCYSYKEHSLSFHHFDNTMSLPQFHNKVCVPYFIQFLGKD